MKDYYRFMQMKLTISWIDNRISYKNLKDDDNLNTLSPLEKDMIWMPTLVFTNTKYREEANFKNESTFATIKINAGSVYTRFSCSRNASLYVCMQYNSKMAMFAAALHLLNKLKLTYNIKAANCSSGIISQPIKVLFIRC